MSGQLVVGTPPGVVIPPGQTPLSPTAIPCAQEKCAWWSEREDCCSIVRIGFGTSIAATAIQEFAEVLEPAENSPLGSIAETLIEIVHLLKRRKD